jgi:hypothetical protein
MDFKELMNNPNFPAILTLTGTVFGAGISAVFGVIIPNYLRSKSEYRLFRRNKLELLYDDINNWFNTSFNVFVLNFYLVLDNKTDWNSYLDYINKSNLEKEKVFFKSEIIINLYFKELEIDFINLTKANQAIIKFINTEIKKNYEMSDDIHIFKPDFHTKVMEIIALAEKLKVHIKDIARRI